MSGIKYTTKDFKTDMAIGGVNGLAFSLLYGFFTASLETSKDVANYGRQWSKLFRNETS